MSFPNCFVDSFQHYSTADLFGLGNGQKWSGVGPQATQANTFISLGTGIAGNSLRIVASASVFGVYKTFPNLATYVIGFRFRINQIISNAFQNLCGLYDSGTPQAILTLNGDGTLSLTRAGTAVTGGRSTNTLNINTWYYIEMMCTINSSIGANTWQLNVNGVNWANVAAGQSSKNSANSTANQVYLGIGNMPGNGVQTMDFCDFYCDGGGSVNSGAFWGDIKVECHWPIAQGTYSAWFPYGGLRVGCVNDITPNGDTNFIADNTINDKSTYIFQPLVYPPASIMCTQVVHTSRKPDAGTRQIADYCLSSGTAVAGNTVSLTNTYQIYTNVLTQDPHTSAAWTANGINAAEFGVEEVS